MRPGRLETVDHAAYEMLVDPKGRARLIYDTLRIGSLPELEHAAREQRLRDVPGLGEKAEANILRELERLKQRSRRLPLELGLNEAQAMLARLRHDAPIERAAVT